MGEYDGLGTDAIAQPGPTSPASPADTVGGATKPPSDNTQSPGASEPTQID